MACERFRDALKDAAAGGGAAPHLVAHLAACEGCRAELALLRQALALADGELGRLVSADPSPELAARIRVALSEAAPAAVEGWRLVPRLAIAAAALAAIAVSVVLSRREPGPRPTTFATTSQSTAAPATAMPVPVATPEPRRADAPAAMRERPTAHGSRVVRRLPPSVPPEPEVLVPPGELDALVRLAASLRRRAVAPDSLLVADRFAPLAEATVAQVAALAEATVAEAAPLEIVPLDPAESGVD